MRAPMILLALGACEFRGGGGGLDDGAIAEVLEGALDGLLDDGMVPIDTIPDGPIGCATPQQWGTNFDTDPTTVDLNGDGIRDWKIRDQVAEGQLPGTITNGIWRVSGLPTKPLDTNPIQDYTTRTRVAVRMRNTVRTGAYGAVFWINVDYSAATYASLYLNLQLDADGLHQTLTLVHKPLDVTTILVTVPDLPTTMVDVALDIEPSIDRVVMAVNGNTSVKTYGLQARGNLGRWATVLAYGADSEFDFVRVDVCP